jgi:hypothetical protein
MAAPSAVAAKKAGRAVITHGAFRNAIASFMIAARVFSWCAASRLGREAPARAPAPAEMLLSTEIRDLRAAFDRNPRSAQGARGLASRARAPCQSMSASHASIASMPSASPAAGSVSRPA